MQLELGLAPAMQEPVPQEPAQDVMAERLALEPGLVLQRKQEQPEVRVQVLPE